MLGLLLFLCYINDITSGISSAIKLYADDVLVYRVVNCIDDCKISVAKRFRHFTNMGSQMEHVIQLSKMRNKQTILSFPYTIPKHGNQGGYTSKVFRSNS